MGFSPRLTHWLSAKNYPSSDANRGPFPSPTPSTIHKTPVRQSQRPQAFSSYGYFAATFSSRSIPSPGRIGGRALPISSSAQFGVLILIGSTPAWKGDQKATRPTMTSRVRLRMVHKTPRSDGSQAKAWPSALIGIVSTQRSVEPAVGNSST